MEGKPANFWDVVNMPDDAYLYFPNESENIIKIDKKPLRIFFDGQVVYTERELKGLNTFKEYLKKHKKTLSEWWNDAHILRFLEAYHYKNEKTLKYMVKYSEWREGNFHASLKPEVEKNLKNGIIYVHGRDHRFRPIVVFNPYKINTKETKAPEILDTFSFFLSYVVNCLMLPGQVEAWNFIIDLNNTSLSDIPASLLKSILKSLQNNFTSRLHRMYILNAPKSFSIIWTIAKLVLDDCTTFKISIIGGGHIPEGLFKETNKKQVEKRFGGEAQNNDNNFWPPYFPSEEYFLEEEKKELVLVDRVKYADMAKAGELRNNLVLEKLLREEK